MLTICENISDFLAPPKDGGARDQKEVKQHEQI